MTKEVTEIHIFGPQSMLKGQYPKIPVHQVTSFDVEGAQFSKAYRKGLWDGRKSLMNKRTGSFPTGLVSIVKETCEEAGYNVVVTDHRMKPEPRNKNFDLHGVKMEGKYSYQLDACEKAVKAEGGCLKMATGAGKTECAAAITQYYGLPMLFLVLNVELMYQSRDRFQKRLNLSKKECGVVGGGEWSPGSYITVGCVPTLASRLEKEPKKTIEFLSNFDVMFADECHGTASDEYFKVSNMTPAYYRFFLSATPLDRSDGADLGVIASAGDIIVDIPNKELAALKITAETDILFDSITSPIIPARTPYPTVYKQGVSENPELVNKIVEWTKVFTECGLSTLIMVEEISHGNLIDESLWNNTDGVFIPHAFIHGSEDLATRASTIEDFGNRTLPVMIASRILDQGISVDTIDALILAGSRKSKIKTIQRLGRGLRGEKLIALEFANTCHKHLIKHSLQRLRDYQAEECFPIHEIKADTDKVALVKELWNDGKRKRD